MGDWLVTLSHIVGACVGAGEAALVIMENMSNTWKLTRLLSLVMTALCFLDLNFRVLKFWAEPSWPSRFLLLVGVALLFIAYLVDFLAVEEASSLPVDFLAAEAGSSLTFNLLLLVGAVAIFLGVRKDRVRQSGGTNHLKHEPVKHVLVKVVPAKQADHAL